MGQHLLLRKSAGGVADEYLFLVEQHGYQGNSVPS